MSLEVLKKINKGEITTLKEVKKALIKVNRKRWGVKIARHRVYYTLQAYEGAHIIYAFNDWYLKYWYDKIVNNIESLKEMQNNPLYKMRPKKFAEDGNPIIYKHTITFFKKNRSGKVKEELYGYKHE